MSNYSDLIEDVYDALTHATTGVGVSVSADIRQRGDLIPAVVFTLEDATFTRYAGGDMAPVHVRVRFDCLHDSRLEAQTLAADVKTALDGSVAGCLERIGKHGLVLQRCRPRTRVCHRDHIHHHLWEPLMAGAPFNGTDLSWTVTGGSAAAMGVVDLSYQKGEVPRVDITHAGSTFKTYAAGIAEADSVTVTHLEDVVTVGTSGSFSSGEVTPSGTFRAESVEVSGSIDNAIQYTSTFVRTA